MAAIIEVAAIQQAAQDRGAHLSLYSNKHMLVIPVTVLDNVLALHLLGNMS